MFISTDFTIHYHSQKLGNSVYLSPIYINLLILFLTLGILLNVIVHVFLIFNESLLVFVLQYLNHVPFFANISLG